MPWLVTAYVPGTSLSDAVERQGPLPEASVLALAAGLAEGLIAIHAAGVIHRDLKPSNVLLAQDGPRIIDFGISSAAGATALTGTGFMIGSPGFMSPEQAEGLTVGPASDIFSLAGVLIYAARGEGPFGSGDTAALLYRVVHGKPNTDDVPDNLRPLIKRSLSRDPKRRPTATAVPLRAFRRVPVGRRPEQLAAPAHPRPVRGRIRPGRGEPAPAGREPALVRAQPQLLPAGLVPAEPVPVVGGGSLADPVAPAARWPWARRPGRAPDRRQRHGRPADPDHAVHADPAPADHGLSRATRRGQGYADPQAPQYPGQQGYPGQQSYPGQQQYPGQQGYTGQGRATPASRAPARAGIPASRLPGQQGYTGPQGSGPQGYTGQQQYPEPQGYRTGQGRPGRARVRWPAGGPAGRLVVGRPAAGRPAPVPGQGMPAAEQWYGPGAVQGPQRKRPRWMAPVGAAAAIVVIIVVLVVTLSPGSPKNGRLSRHRDVPVRQPSRTAPTPTASGTPTTGELTLAQFQVGDCLTGANLQLNKTTPWPKLSKAVPCDQGHTAEVFYANENHWSKNTPLPRGHGHHD